MINLTQVMRVTLLLIVVIGSIYVFANLGITGTIILGGVIASGYVYEKLLPKANNDEIR